MTRPKVKTATPEVNMKITFLVEGYLVYITLKNIFKWSNLGNYGSAHMQKS